MEVFPAINPLYLSANILRWLTMRYDSAYYASFHAPSLPGIFQEYPVSTGHIHITSGENPHAAPDFDPCLLRECVSLFERRLTMRVLTVYNSPADVAVMRYAFKKGREFARRMPIFEGELKLGDPMFAQGNIAAREDTSPVDITEPDIVYTAEDDKAIDDHHRKFGGCCMFKCMMYSTA